MMEEARPIEKGFWQSVGTIVAAATSWVFLSVILAVAFTVAVIECTSLGPLFVPNILSAWALACLAGTFLTVLLERHQAKRTKPSKGNQLTRRQAVVLVVVGLIVIPAMLGTGTLKREFDEQRNAHMAEEARNRFAVAMYSGMGPEFELEAVNQTLKELEDSFQQLRHTWVLPETVDKIRVWLLRNLQDYQSITGKQDAGGHAFCPSEFGPVIVIPLEKAPNATADDNFSRTPMHEMVHALMCQSLGEEAFYALPRWFHEGMAERYEMEGFSRVMLRIEKRALLWLNRHRLMASDRFCAIRLGATDVLERALFYETSREFVNSLEARHGLYSLNLVLDDVRTGATFKESMERRLGGSCNELYTRWRDSF